MNPEEVRYFLQHLDPVQQRGKLDEELRDVTAIIEVDVLSSGEIGAILSNILRYPSVVTDCSVDIDANGRSEHLFRVTTRGVRLNNGGFEELQEETDVSGANYRSNLSSHSNAGREGEMIYELMDLLQKIESDTQYDVDFSILIDKNEIIDIWRSSKEDWTVDPDCLRPQFWYDISNFVDWLDTNRLVEYTSEMFDPDEMPLLIYYQDSTEDELKGTDHFPVFTLLETPDFLSSQFESYQDKSTVTRRNTSYFHEAPVVSPSLFSGSPSLQKLFREVFLYSVFAVFSDRVATNNSKFQFSAEHGPNKLDEDPIEIEDVAAEISDLELEELAELYLDFSRREDRDKFVKFWRQSMLQNCNKITDIPNEIDNIKQSYRFIESEVIEKNFDELSDAVRDTNAFMTEITSQVSDTTTALSDEIQRLVFALLGAIIANLFLILRWSNFDTVIPFSLFVISATLIFYFPLIDRRIEELDEMKSKGQEDYETYKGLISRFTGEAFDFDDLEERKDDYLEYADKRIEWSRRKVRQIHAVLIATGFFFVIFANLNYPPLSIQVGFSALFILSTLYISYRTHAEPDDYSYHKLKIPVLGSDLRKNPLPAATTVASSLILVAHFGGYYLM